MHNTLSVLVGTFLVLGAVAVHAQPAPHGASNTVVEQHSSDRDRNPASSGPAGSGVQEATQVPGASEPPRRLGLGGRAGGFTLGVGGSVRHWGAKRVGFEAAVSRYSIGASDTSFGVASSASLSTVQIAPSILYALNEPDRSADLAVAPYVGGGLNVMRSSSSATASAFGTTIRDSSSATNVGAQGFVGAELLFKDMPKFRVSGEFGFYSTAVPFSGFSVGGFALSVAGHFYVR